ncbi:MAG: molybdopterin-synthase adenylyltransferase MoeB [Chloroherpetonaceae bacterium]|nr:molybdopterin-synthase adenylyltransferase MoeB [Chloroherpetonaceae bacterium]
MSIADESKLFSNDEIGRYSRHLLLPEVGFLGQSKLKQASVLLIGAGGLSSPAAMYLAAAGVGKIGIVDNDVVELSNLQRQVIHRTEQIGKSKLESAKNTIHSINPFVEVKGHDTRLTAKNAKDIVRLYDLIVDGSDNFPTRYLINDICFFLKKPLVFGSIFRFEGQVSVFCTGDWENETPYACYRCLYPEPPSPGEVPNCSESGVLGVLPGIIGSLQAIEAIKLITGIGELLINRVLRFDALKMKFNEIRFSKQNDCALCGDHPSIVDLIDYESFCGYSEEKNDNKLTLNDMKSQSELTVHELKKRLDGGEAPFILDVRNLDEWQICKIEGAKLIPLPELPNRLKELNPDQEIIVHCKMGGRSAQASEYLKQNGFKDVKNLVGGINAWANEIDKTMLTY